MIPELSQANSIFLETSVVIYYVEDHPDFAAPIHELFEYIDRGEKTGVCSFVTLYEVLSKPFELGRSDLIQLYRRVLIDHSQ